MSRPKPPAANRRGAGKATPSSSLHLTLEEHFASHSLSGLLASQRREPNHEWARDWSFKMGRVMAREAMRRRRARKQ